MKIDILTLFPEMFESVMNASIMGRARENGLLAVETHDIRAYTENKHNKADDYPFGGGAGLVMMAQPIFDCMDDVLSDGVPAKRILLSPRGRPLTTALARELAKEKRLVLLCGHYEGVDTRIIEEIVDEEISIGDFVLTGGELPACILTDAVARLCDGVLAAPECYENESLSEGLVEYPQYTRPVEFRGRTVPEVLVSGHHANIEKWRREQSLAETERLRPDLLKK